MTQVGNRDKGRRNFFEDFNVTNYVLDMPTEGMFRVSRAIYTDSDIFEMELDRIFSKTWIFLGHESQLPNRHDFMSTYIARQPVLVTRDGNGNLHGFFNSCRHRGAMVCRIDSGTKELHTCPYHGWTYDSAGNAKIMSQRTGCYSEQFQNQDHNLVRLPKFASYRGILFGCLDANAPELEEWLGDARYFVDLVVDQGGEHGLEFVPGRSIWTYDGNWKLQADNSDDNYHVPTAHATYVELHARRSLGQSRNTDVLMADWNKRLELRSGMFTWKHGHTLSWIDNPAPEVRPLYQDIDKLKRRVSEEQLTWMLTNRNLTLYPSVQLCDSTSLMIRTFRPLAVDKTEMKLFCLAPIGEDPKARRIRMRQHEDAFGATAFANPDDHAVYEACQDGYVAQSTPWLQGFERGLSIVNRNPSSNDNPGKTEVRALTNLTAPYSVYNEAVHHGGYREWARLMSQPS
jgi:phenylpropionate dioxygenase-like ring-hydroxylating dioxygenase large terminal subunit